LYPHLELPLPVILRIRLKKDCVLCQNQRISVKHDFVKRGNKVGIKLPLIVDKDIKIVIHSDGSFEKVNSRNEYAYTPTFGVKMTTRKILNDIYG